MSERRHVVLALVLGSLAAGPGALPRAGGDVDPRAFVAWLVLVAPAVGYALGAVGSGLDRALVVPAVWTVVLLAVQSAVPGALERPLPAMGVVAGLFAAGIGAGGLVGGRPWAGAGGLLLAGLVLAGLPVQGGLADAAEESWARHSPRHAQLVLETSPVGIAFDAAGWDWTHAQPLVYRVSGVEWFHREPRDPGVAALTALVVGCALAVSLPRLNRRRRRPGSGGEAAEGG